MLKVAAEHYLNSVGDDKFVPNPDYPEFINADCLGVVIKQKPKFFWHKEFWRRDFWHRNFWQIPIYTFDNFSLNDLLNAPLPTDKSQFLRAAEPLTPNYEFTSNYRVKGKFGGKIASLVSLDVAQGKNVSLSVNLQELMIQSIDYSAVQNMLRTKKVDTRSNYLNRLAQDKYNVVCLITRCIYINKLSTINVNEDFHKSKRKSHKSNNVKSLTFDTGTRLAFEFCECLIGPDGSIELIDKSDKVDILQMIPEYSTVSLLPNDYALKTSSDKADAVDRPSNRLKSHWIGNGLDPKYSRSEHNLNCVDEVLDSERTISGSE